MNKEKSGVSKLLKNNISNNKNKKKSVKKHKTQYDKNNMPLPD